MIAVQKGTTAAVCCCVCEIVAFHRRICTFGLLSVVLCAPPRHQHLWCLVAMYFQSNIVFNSLIIAKNASNIPTVPTCRHDLQYQHVCTTYCTNMSALPTVPTCLHDLLYQHDCTTYCTNMSARPTVTTCLQDLL